METKNVNVHVPNQGQKKIEIPFLCPICGVSNNPHNVYKAYEQFDNRNIGIFRHTCTGCRKIFYTIQLFTKEKVELVTQYPINKIKKYDEKLVKMSPRFQELYNQSEESERKGHIDLAGMGYRAAMEVLIKDYALSFELDTRETIAKKNLNNAISKYFQENISTVPADVVRKLGNDFAHWDKEYPDISLDILKQYLEIVVQSIMFQLMIKHPPIEIKR